MSAAVQATRATVSTHRREKLEALRNAVLNSALSRALDHERQTIFFHLIEMFSVTHFDILRLFADPKTFPKTRLKELQDRRELSNLIMSVYVFEAK